jgi:hypothetical protein
MPIVSTRMAYRLSIGGLHGVLASLPICVHPNLFNSFASNASVKYSFSSWVAVSSCDVAHGMVGLHGLHTSVGILAVQKTGRVRSRLL